VSFILLFSLWAGPANASVDGDYFKLHQATGFYEQYLGQRCPTGKAQALALLKSIESPSPLQAKSQELSEKIAGGPKFSINDVEQFRLSIHELQEQKGFAHQARWHDDVVKECRKGDL
jgi:hypothetical protein